MRDILTWAAIFDHEKMRNEYQSTSSEIWNKEQV